MRPVWHFGQGAWCLFCQLGYAAVIVRRDVGGVHANVVRNYEDKLKQIYGVPAKPIGFVGIIVNQQQAGY